MRSNRDDLRRLESVADVEDTAMTVTVSTQDGAVHISCHHTKAPGHEDDELCYACAFHVNAATQMLLGSRRIRRG